MRTTITLDDDVVALVEGERARTGESFKTAVNRLLRKAGRAERRGAAPALPVLPGRPLVDVSDASAVLAALDDERRAGRGLV
jgi:hypothetical protein